MRTEYIDGQIVEDWKLISEQKHAKKRHHIYWLMEHIPCGIRKIARIDQIIGKHGVRCRPCYDRALSLRIETDIYQTVKRRTKSRGFDLQVSKEYLLELIVKQDYKCSLSGLPIWFGHPAYKERPKRFNTASLDRIDSTIGYVPGNVQWVHKTINILKQSLKEDELLWFISHIVLHNIDKLDSLIVDPIEMLSRKDTRQRGRDKFTVEQRKDIESEYLSGQFGIHKEDLLITSQNFKNKFKE